MTDQYVADIVAAVDAHKADVIVVSNHVHDHITRLKRQIDAARCPQGKRDADIKKLNRWVFEALNKMPLSE